MLIKVDKRAYFEISMLIKRCQQDNKTKAENFLEAINNLKNLLQIKIPSSCFCTAADNVFIETLSTTFQSLNLMIRQIQL